MTSERYVRLCTLHRAQLQERNGAVYCPMGMGHYPDTWIARDQEKGTEEKAGAELAGTREVKAWRESVDTTRPVKVVKAPGYRNPTTSVVEKIQPAPAAPVFKPPVKKFAYPEKPAEDRPAKGVEMAENRPCGCGPRGPHKRTCPGPRAASAAPAPARAPRAQRQPRPARVTALATAQDAPANLEELRAKLRRDLAELDRALDTFELIERRIPKRHVEAARALLVEAGVAQEALAGRQSIALAKIVAGVGAALFVADGWRRWSGRKKEILVALAAALRAA